MAQAIPTSQELIALGKAAAKAWWSDLLSYLPQSGAESAARPIAKVSRDKVVIYSNTGVSEVGDAPGQEFAPWHDANGDMPRDLLDALNGAAKERRSTVIELDRDMVLVRRLRWPLLAESSLRNLILGQLDALTPWSGAEALVGWSVVRRHLALRQIEVDIFTVPKVRLIRLSESLREMTAKPIQFRPAPGEDGSEAAPVLRSSTEEAGNLATRKTVRALLVLMPLALALAIAYLPLQQKQARLATLQAEAEALRTEVAGSLALEQNLSGLMQEFSRLQQKRVQAATVVETLDLLTAELSDEVWLDRLVYTRGQAELSGSAKAPYEMIAALQALPQVSDVSLKSPIVKGSLEGYQRFQIDVSMGETP